MASARSTLEAVAVVETGSVARGFLALDALVKKASVTVKVARPVSPGKFVILFGGDVETTRESWQAALEVASSDIVDELFLPGAHPSLLPAVDGALGAAQADAIGIVEMTTVASAIQAADVALKAVDVAVLKMQLAVGVGGKGWFTLAGALGDVSAALDAVRDAVRTDRVVGIELIPQPHGEVRGWMG